MCDASLLRGRATLATSSALNLGGRGDPGWHSTEAHLHAKALHLVIIRARRGDIWRHKRCEATWLFHA